ncbi:optic atrophy 3 protein-domain-containing protein [Neohortaea acidophila]|uniref:Optic atrophy 3 protein-domain-containing protein n=1 Tax=Neohortaea acidophila TaxID=245834 RepID=A0A6A6PR04_9PEZI|nr:optic atrophy 3 protein-domain-containing protein [Neohortaea acidophila]KAF2482530.1 optic atrophy 3 protein-domain-containing protein [Neohortaea acidophila]
MSLTFKLLSLVIRTAAKPIGNYIKRQAHDHDGFRRFAINQAQRVHRIDMRMRLGLLHDPEAQQRMHEREQKAAEDKKRKAEAPTVRSEEEQKKYDEQKVKDEQDGKRKKEEKPRIKIRPLSDARAIELGANFFSETFIFMVAVGLLLAENFRSSRKASSRRDEIQERLDTLEEAMEHLRNQHNLPELEALNERIAKAREARASWFNPAGWWRRTEPEEVDNAAAQSESASKPIPGNVPGPPPEQSVKPTNTPNDSTSPKTQPARINAVEATKKSR